MKKYDHDSDVRKINAEIDAEQEHPATKLPEYKDVMGALAHFRVSEGWNGFDELCAAILALCDRMYAAGRYDGSVSGATEADYD